MMRPLALTLGGLLLLSACNKGAGGGGTPGGTPADGGGAAAGGGPLAEAKSLLDAGRADDVLARLQGNNAPEALYLQGAAWAKKAETAPLPTAEALAPGSPRDAIAVTPEWKPEEQRAIE